MGEMADMFLEQVEYYEERRSAYRAGEMSDQEAYDEGIIDELGYEIGSGHGGGGGRMERHIMNEQALQRIEEPPQGELAAIVKAPITPAQAKIDAVANLTMKAYERASTLQLTPEEVSALQAEFPDEAFQKGAAGKEHLIYIEHAHLRDRLNKVFGPGQWAIIPRNRWAEDFSTGKGTEASRVYVEAMLCIRGCFVAEAVGDMVYYKNNDSQNYGDAVEGAKTAALRRCAKELGIGLQAWKKEFCEGWWNRKNGKGSQTTQRQQPANVPCDTKGQDGGKTGATSTPKEPPQATEKTRAWFLAEMRKCFSDPTLLQWAMDDGPPYALRPDEGLEDWPLELVPTTKEALKEKVARCAEFMDVKPELQPHIAESIEPPGGWQGAAHGTPEPSRPPSTSHPPAKSAPKGQPEGKEHHSEAWYQFPMPFGKNAGTILGKLAKNYLYGLWANYVVETEYKGKPKKKETIEADRTFRVMLDQAGVFYKFDEPKGGSSDDMGQEGDPTAGSDDVPW